MAPETSHLKPNFGRDLSPSQKHLVEQLGCQAGSCFTMLTMAPGPTPFGITEGKDLGRGSLGQGAGREKKGNLPAVQRPPRSRVQSWHGGVAGAGCPGGHWPDPYEPKGSAVARPASLPWLPGWASGRGAAQAGAPPGGAQSLALTQLNAGAVAAPPWAPAPGRTHRLK